MPERHEPPAALLFDVFGTLVDWRTGVTDGLCAFGERHGIAADWGAFADEWRGAYAPSMDRVRRGEVPWQNLDALHRASLLTLFDRYGIANVAAGEVERVARVWHALPAWPDTVAGLRRLRERFIIASLSNGNVALQIDLRRHARLPFDMLFSAELFQHYKPDARTYLGACELLDLAPARVMLVAAHVDDLQAARSFGLRTAFVRRPFEFGPPAAAVVRESAPASEASPASRAESAAIERSGTASSGKGTAIELQTRHDGQAFDIDVESVEALADVLGA